MTRLFFALALLAASPATAQQEVRTQTTTADELLSMYRSGNAATKTVAAYWVSGFIGGVMASSMHAEQNGKPVVCFTDAVVGQEFVIENMEKLVREQPDLKTTMWQFVAFTALREAFPCK
jgi:Rap1a immunity proteins